MEKLTEETVIQMHDFLIDATGGEPGLRDSGTLFFIVDAINNESNLFRKAAKALFLAETHPFWDGQKRTAFELADLILRQNNYRFDRNNKSEIVRVIQRIAEYRCPEGEEKISTTVKWLKKIVVKLE